ncbi:MAG: UvrD-helicase domain-containing protein, partial [Burkholderiales bacterium]|nr:UvrD-helicase domain-containing protein [Burkholderiales bacterium]
MKARFADLVGALADNETLRAGLADVRHVPEPAYTDDQWRVLDALLRVLPLAAANLRLAFAAHGEADYIEMTNAARLALGDEETPGEAMLALDYRVQHVLVDEFQDTSHSHHALLAQLTAGWQPGDGRTLFLVGDPMQSIYRFRDADLSLFDRARQHGIGEIRLRHLRL